jgi:hypothetical protein
MNLDEIDNMCNNWPLDAWSIGPNVFRKIIETLPVGSTILEFGSGAGTHLLSKYYKMKSIEENVQYMNQYNSEYHLVPTILLDNKYPEFPDDPTWYDVSVLRNIINKIGDYDCILIDGPKGFRGGLYYNKELFNLNNTLLIFDDTHAYQHYHLMELISQHIGKPYEEFVDGNKKFGIIQK